MSIPESPAELQFERAEPTEEASRRLLCAACSAEIASEYYERGGQLVCPACRARLLAERERGSRLTRFGRALLFGVAAAVAGALLWYGVSKLTGYEFSLIAIVIGFLVGAAVKRGAYRRGGWAYQGLAMFLTYASIVSTYIPAILEAMRERPATESAAAEAADEETSEVSIAPAGAPEAPLVADAAAEPGPGESTAEVGETEGPLPRPIGFAAALLALFAIAFAAPFLSGFENFIGWIILAIGLYEAWKLNRKETLLFDGPFRVGAPHAAPAFETPTPPPPIAP
jgi:DNA-directed RNA polymerase subunit RPC12/RpoP